jgi:5-methylcytosine-specific restriction protein A
MRVRSYDIVMMTKLKMMMKPLRDSPSGAFVMEGKLMAYKPNHPCAHQGCPRLVPAGQKYCEEHQKMHPEDSRSASTRGYGRKWQKASKAFLVSHPLCEECLRHGRYTKATVVDHIVPHRGDSKMFWDRNNWRALCKRCHDQKTGREDSNPYYTY